MIDTDTFLTTLYVLVDDLDQRDQRDQRARASSPVARPLPGPSPRLSRSEVVTLALFAQWDQFPSERAFYRYAQRHLRSAFPTLPTRSQYNRLLRQVIPFLIQVGAQVAQLLLPEGCAYEVLDSTGAPVRNDKRRGSCWLAGQVDRGYCTRIGWYTGFHVLSVVAPDGIITGFGCAPASTADQRLAETLLAARHHPQARLPEAGRASGGQYYLADTGFEGMRWWPHWLHDYGARVLIPPKRTHPCPQPWPKPWPKRLRRAFAGWRQVVETVHDRLLGRFGLAHERPHTVDGFRARLAARVALHNVCCMSAAGSTGNLGVRFWPSPICSIGNRGRGCL